MAFRLESVMVVVVVVDFGALQRWSLESGHVGNERGRTVNAPRQRRRRDPSRSVMTPIRSEQGVAEYSRGDPTESRPLASLWPCGLCSRELSGVGVPRGGAIDRDLR